MPEYLSVDESMLPYYGHHSTKQYIRGKPINFGYKLWCFATFDGYILHVEPYCGSNTKLQNIGRGHGGDEFGLVDKKSEIKAGQHVVFDNFFTSFSLLKALLVKGIGRSRGTVRENPLESAPLPSKKAM